jgi:ParB family transcriptional regulator, chromosome partitioning protein
MGQIMSNKGNSTTEKMARALAAAQDSTALPSPTPALNPKTRPGMGGVNLGFLVGEDLEDARKRATQAELEVARLTAERTKPFKIALDRLVSVSGRRRNLSTEQFTELRENLRNNPLIHPIAVQPRSDGTFEIVSGENRVAAFRELGILEIAATLPELSDGENVRSTAAFHANLMQPQLPDFEKYLGFKGELQRTGLSKTEIARAAGVDLALLSNLMTFDLLPEKAKQLLTDAPRALGFQSARKLVQLMEKADGAVSADKIVDAVSELVAGRVTQEQAVKLAASVNKSVESKETPREIKFKQGAKTYCKVRIVAGELRFSFKDAAQRKLVEDELFAVLKKFSKVG